MQDNKHRWSSPVEEEVSYQAEDAPCPQHVLSANVVPAGSVRRSVYTRSSSCIISYVGSRTLIGIVRFYNCKYICKFVYHYGENTGICL